jgi:hypothetical protein
MWVCLDCEDDRENGGESRSQPQDTDWKPSGRGGSKGLGKTRKFSILRDREDGASYDAEGATRAGEKSAKEMTDTKEFEADLTRYARPEGGHSQNST